MVETRSGNRVGSPSHKSPEDGSRTKFLNVVVLIEKALS
jgi:hypothetical protein